ncbi:4Fe-4S dicluster domain-containing protein [bacterium]|nr:4Fe-4S dicluster domain-containing protein [bacterium]
MAKLDTEFKTGIQQLGDGDFNSCFNCGNCTAVCKLSTEEDSFPREMVRYSILGLEEDLKSSLKPWLCYYCGECSEACPRQADPGELMMSLRRWLTAKYDWTGLSGLLYRSLPISIIAFILLAITVIFVSASEDFNLEDIMHYGHYFEMISIGVVSILILTPNIIRMWWYTVGRQKIRPSVNTYIKEMSELIIHMFTQKQALDCEEGKFRWFEHLILVLGYLSLLFTTVVLDWFGTDNMFIIVLGYVESAVVFVVTFDFVLSRIKKKKEVNKYSQPSDWLFVIWLFLMGLTAFVTRMFIDMDILENNVWMYIVHLIILVQWALLIVPFGKWSHFLYRSFAMYFSNVINSTSSEADQG